MSEKKETIEVESKGLEVNLLPDEQLTSKRIYSNFVQITHSPYDFTLRFCDAGPIYNTKAVVDNGGNFNIPIVAEIAIPLEMMPNLIKAMQSQLKKHQDSK